MKGRVQYLEMGPWPFHCGVCTDPKAFQKELDRLGVKAETKFFMNDWCDATAHRLYDKRGALTVILALRRPGEKNSNPHAYASLVAHEALHAVQYLRHKINDNDCLGWESEAYLLQSITQACLNFAYTGTLDDPIEPRPAQRTDGSTPVRGVQGNQDGSQVPSEKPDSTGS